MTFFEENFEDRKESEPMVSYDDFFISTRALFVSCEKPDEEPFYISPVSKSEYYKGSDDKGEYVIRNSNHWIQEGTDFEKPKSENACFWEIDIPYDKKVDKNLKEISPSYSTEEDLDFISGKCYLKDFKRI